MSKYNNMKSIPISSIKKEEIGKAIKEWAEGSSHMEELLWACFNNGVETSGCHAGAQPYLDIKVNDAADKVKKMLRSIQEIDGVQILIMPDGGNPYSGNEFYMPRFSLWFSTPYEETANDIFDKMKESLNPESTKDTTEEGLFDSMLDFYDFFAFKESGLMFRSRNESGEYTFSIEADHSNEKFDYLKNLFEKAGLEQIEEEPDFIDFWGFTATTAEEFSKKMMLCRDVVIAGWSLGLPNEITEDMDFNTEARIRRRQFGDTPEGKKKFESWLQNKRNNQENEPEIEDMEKEDSFREGISAGLSLEDQSANSKNIQSRLNKEPTVEETSGKQKE